MATTSHGFVLTGHIDGDELLSFHCLSPAHSMELRLCASMESGRHEAGEVWQSYQEVRRRSNRNDLRCSESWPAELRMHNTGITVLVEDCSSSWSWSHGSDMILVDEGAIWTASMAGRFCVERMKVCLKGFAAYDAYLRMERKPR